MHVWEVFDLVLSKKGKMGLMESFFILLVIKRMIKQMTLIKYVLK